MKLKKYNKGTSRYGMKIRPEVRVNQTTFAFNMMAKESLQLKIGDRLNFYQDEDEPKDWYFEITEDPLGFELRDNKNTGLICNGSETARMLLKSCVTDQKKSKAFMIATVPTDGMYAIITSAAK